MADTYALIQFILENSLSSQNIQNHFFWGGGGEGEDRSWKSKEELPRKIIFNTVNKIGRELSQNTLNIGSPLEFSN